MTQHHGARASAHSTERSRLLPDGSDASSGTLAEEDQGASRSSSHGITPIRASLIVVALGLLIFLQATNISMLTTTQSTIAADLDAFEKASWFTSAYLVSMSSVAPITGRLSHIFSPRNVIFVSTIIFCIGCILTAFAPNFTGFMVGRSVSGIGAAGVFTVSTILVLQLAPTKQRGLSVGLLNSGFTVGVSVGAIVAGALLERTGWRALFWMQAPLGFVAALCLLINIPETLSSDKPKTNHTSMISKLAHVDYVGAALLTGSIVFLLVGLSAPKIVVLPVVISLILLPIFILNESYVAIDPIVPVTVLKSRGTLFTCLATVGLMMARWAVLFYSPVYVLSVRGWTPATAGTILIPTNAGFAAGGILSGWIHIRRDGSFYFATLVIFTLFPISLVALMFAITANSSIVFLVITLIVNGLCVGASLVYSLAHVLHLTLPETHFIVTALLGTFRGFAGSFGSAIGGGIFARSLDASLRDNFKERGLDGRAELIRRLIGSPALVSSLYGQEREVAIQGYVDAIRALFLAGIVLGIAMICVQAATGWKGPSAQGNEEDRPFWTSESSADGVFEEGVEGVVQEAGHPGGLTVPGGGFDR
ncbi:MFS general substrate transporter [Aulographum hederae CBS 113979]|uniref:MFS general substrate transporter n=1 Tax=Aulographum hederae CBS 113979 TaxID=1176131 RepID=A0A6G1GVK7_9PEZI|nr:MFS general substrate transporter [Aulographum hederae CBS 113979]